jgi:ABC-type dipeptide/oligopeptide/nickel transport system permease component
MLKEEAVVLSGALALVALVLGTVLAALLGILAKLTKKRWATGRIRAGTSQTRQ